MILFEIVAFLGFLVAILYYTKENLEFYQISKKK